MRRKLTIVAVALTLVCSMMFTSCIGRFALFNKVKDWNNQVGSKFVNELVFVAFWIVPVYEITAPADLLVINSIEFWSGSNPVAYNTTKAIDTENGRYLVYCDKSGYTITSERDNSVVKLAFNDEDDSWSVQTGDADIKFMQFVDDTHVKMIGPDGNFSTVELNEAGVYAYQQLALGSSMALR